MVRRQAVEQLQFTDPVLFLVFASLFQEVDQLLHIVGPAMERPEKIELDDEEIDVRCPVILADVGLSPKDYQPLGYRGTAPRLG